MHDPEEIMDRRPSGKFSCHNGISLPVAGSTDIQSIEKPET